MKWFERHFRNKLVGVEFITGQRIGVGLELADSWVDPVERFVAYEDELEERWEEVFALFSNRELKQAYYVLLTKVWRSPRTLPYYTCIRLFREVVVHRGILVEPLPSDLLPQTEPGGSFGLAQGRRHDEPDFQPQLAQELNQSASRPPGL